MNKKKKWLFKISNLIKERVTCSMKVSPIISTSDGVFPGSTDLERNAGSPDTDDVINASLTTTE